MSPTVQAHNQRAATVWPSGGAACEHIGRGVADAIEQAVVRLGPLPGERILDLATGTPMYRERDGEAAWQTFVQGYGPMRMLAVSLDEERRVALQRDFVAFHAGFAEELGVCVPRTYRVTVGRRR
jgi:hypothetical protein